MMLAIGMFVAISGNQKASALDSTQWEKMRGYIDDYFNGQFDPGRDGEAGIVYGKLALQNALDSNGDMTSSSCTNIAVSYGFGDRCDNVDGVLGEGDDAANRPVLIDNISSDTNIIPGTSFRCKWNVGDDCFSQASIAEVRELVDAHEEAGFSTDIAVYCHSAHTAGPTTGGFGILAQTGALSSDGDVPNVYELEFARLGWTNGYVGAFTYSNAIASPETAGTYSTPATPTPPPNCELASTDAELVRCQVDWAIRSDGGNVGNSTSDTTVISNAGQTVDVRTGSVSTLDTAGDNIQVPINTLFSNSGLANLDPLASTIIVSRTQFGGQTAIGLKMLGYNTVPGGYINRGIPRWNSTQGEQQVALGDALPLLSWAAFTAPGPVDTTPPTIMSSSATAIGATTAEVTRVTATDGTGATPDPATSKIHLDGGGQSIDINSTILNADKTVTIYGLMASTAYTGTLTVYDGYANGASTAISFTTAASGDPLGLSPNTTGPAVWDSYADYTAGIVSVDWTITNNGATTAPNVMVVSIANTNGVTVSSGSPAHYGDIASGASATRRIKYNSGNTPGFSWLTTNVGSSG